MINLTSPVRWYGFWAAIALVTGLVLMVPLFLIFPARLALIGGGLGLVGGVPSTVLVIMALERVQQQR